MTISARMTTTCVYRTIAQTLKQDVDVLNRINTYFKGLIKNIPHLSSSGICCLTISPTEISILYAKIENNKWTLQFCDSFFYRDVANLKSLLTQLVNIHHIAGVDCRWVLQPNDYQLIQLESLPVSPDEFQSAIRWKIKHLLNFPIEDAVIDHFSLPAMKSRDAIKNITVTIARASYLQKNIELIEESGLVPTVIDIQELALRNLTAFYETDEKTTALIFIFEKYSQLIVTRQKIFYLSRNIDFGSETLDKKGMSKEIDLIMDKFALEIQRSFDYYISQWRNPLPTRIYVTSSTAMSFDVAGSLSQRLGAQVQLLNVDDFVLHPTLATIKGKYLPLIGSLLREK